MAQSDTSSQVPASTLDHANQSQGFWRRLMSLGRDRENGSFPPPSSPSHNQDQGAEQDNASRSGLIRRVSRKVVPGLPRAQTFKRQQSELRNKLEPVQPTPAERRAVSVDRRLHPTISHTSSNPRTSAPDFLGRSFSAAPSIASIPSAPTSPVLMEKENLLDRIGESNGPEPTEFETPQDPPHVPDALSNVDTHSITTSQYENMIHEELERIWILNLSMHFRDKSKREKFFVTYREKNIQWRRVTISLDYRNAPENSLEMELVATKFQRDKSAKIYEAIRESLADIQFYDTVTNLKLQTTEGRLHVHVVEDVNEIIHYPSVHMIQHMRCRRVKEKDLQFESHMSGFVYKVKVDQDVLIKKEIPGPDTVDEFLYEINALNRLRTAKNVIKFYGVVVDDEDKYVKGLLISFAEQGALIDVIYDHDHSLPWPTRERWARQIVTGLSEIHESGFVQGDFTLSNIVIDDNGDAKIIDINRRGCPVGWEPPEATPLIESNQRISMYIGVKSDLYQLGMVLWALATQEDEPEAHSRPLRIGADVRVPDWYRRIVDICLSDEPRLRIHALHLLSIFPEPELESRYGRPDLPTISVDDGYSPREYLVETSPVHGAPQVQTVHPAHDWSYMAWSHSYPGNAVTEDPFYYPARGRSPPSPLPSNHDGYDPHYGRAKPTWSDHYNGTLTAPSISDFLPDTEDGQETPEAANRSDTVGMDDEPMVEPKIGTPPLAETGTKYGHANYIGVSEKQQEEAHTLDGHTPSGNQNVAISDILKEMTPNQLNAVECLLQQAKDGSSAASARDETAEHATTEGTQNTELVASIKEGETAPSIEFESNEWKGPGDGAGDRPNTLGPTDMLPSVGLDARTVSAASFSDLLHNKPSAHFAVVPGLGETEAAKTDLPASSPASNSKLDPTSARQPPDLTGIGSAHELTPEPRQDSIREEDFGITETSK